MACTVQRIASAAAVETGGLGKQSASVASISRYSLRKRAPGERRVPRGSKDAQRIASTFRYRQPLVHALARRVWQFLSSLHSTSNETNAFKYRHTSSGRAAACYPVTSVVSVSSLVYGLVWSSPAGRGLERVAACSVGACGMRTMYRGARMGYEWPVTDSISAAAL